MHPSTSYSIAESTTVHSVSQVLDAIKCASLDRILHSKSKDKCVIALEVYIRCPMNNHSSHKFTLWTTVMLRQPTDYS